MATVNVSTTYAIAPDAKTIAGYQAALAALVSAGAPNTTIVTITTDGNLSVTVTDRNAISAIADWVDEQVTKIEPVAVVN